MYRQQTRNDELWVMIEADRLHELQDKADCQSFNHTQKSSFQNRQLVQKKRPPFGVLRHSYQGSRTAYGKRPAMFYSPGYHKSGYKERSDWKQPKEWHRTDRQEPAQRPRHYHGYAQTSTVTAQEHLFCEDPVTRSHIHPYMYETGTSYPLTRDSSESQRLNNFQSLSTTIKTQSKSKNQASITILTEDQRAQINQLENQISLCTLPKKPLTAYQIFENKHFNGVKLAMEHLSQKEIVFKLRAEWDHKLSEEEKNEFVVLEDEGKQDYIARVEFTQNRVNALRDEIHKIKFSANNTAVKPTGKLKFLTAYRFFRREEVPIVKSMYPDLEGKDRHCLVRKRWQALPDEKKITFVMKSRLDRERAIYMNKLNQIRENLLEELPQLPQAHSSASSNPTMSLTGNFIPPNSGSKPSPLQQQSATDPAVAAQSAIERISKEIMMQQKRAVCSEEDSSEECSEEDNTSYGVPRDYTKEIKSCPVPSVSSIQNVSSKDAVTDYSLKRIFKNEDKEIHTEPCEQKTSKVFAFKQVDSVPDAPQKEESKESLVLETQVENGKRMTQLKIFQFMQR